MYRCYDNYNIAIIKSKRGNALGNKIAIIFKNTIDTGEYAVSCFDADKPG